MKKRIEHEELLAEVLNEDESFRAATLAHGLSTLRRARLRRRAIRGLSVVALLLTGLACLLVSHGRRAGRTLIADLPGLPPVATAPSVKTIQGTTIRVLSDDELLGFFKGRPVALAGRPGHQQFYLLDEEKN